MASEAFSPLISGGFLTFFMWFFGIITLASLIWFITYINSSKVRNARTTLTAMIITSISSAIAMTLIMIKYQITFT